MKQQRGIRVPVIINRAVSAPPSVRFAWSDLQHQLYPRGQKDYVLRDTMPVDHDSSCSGLLPDYSKYIAYEQPSTASRPIDEKESDDLNCSEALPSRYSLYSHSRDVSSRGGGRGSSRLLYRSSNFAASSEGNVSRTEQLQPDVRFHKGLAARNHSPLSDFPVMESMERHCVAKYQHSADESTSQMLSEDGFRYFKDDRVGERGERYVKIRICIGDTRINFENRCLRFIPSSEKRKSIYFIDVAAILWSHPISITTNIHLKWCHF